jgi:hypothetical protein
LSSILAPRHTNAVEQYVIEGEYVGGVGDDTYSVSAGDFLLIPTRVETGEEVRTGRRLRGFDVVETEHRPLDLLTAALIIATLPSKRPIRFYCVGARTTYGITS